MPRSRANVLRWIAIAVPALVVLAILLLSLPLVSLVSAAKESALIGHLADNKRLAALLLGPVALAAGTWIIWKRQFRLLAVGACAGLLMVMTFCAYRFQRAYPMADLFSPQRYGDSWKILLGRDALLSRFEPKPILKVPNRAVTRAAYPVIDMHFHLESMPASISPERLIQAMDEAGVAQIVNLGGTQGLFERLSAAFRDKYPDRIILFAKPDPDALMRKDGVAGQVAWLRKAAQMGARGMKENKSFGLGQRDAEGRLITVDDPRLDPYWELAGQLGWPVLVHTGEPGAFWLPVDGHNERFGELLDNPDWSLYGRDVPSLKELMEQRERLLARHPGTNFIGAHLGMNPDDLQYAAYLLDKYPNYYVDMSSVVSELGRHPYSTRSFFIKYQDRIVFGTDGGYGLDPATGWTPERMFRSYFEFLETENEYIEYPQQSITKQGSWRVYGINLPPEVLEKIYVLNARKLMPSEADVRARLAALQPVP